MKFSYDHAGVPWSKVERAAQVLTSEHERLLDVIRSESCDDPRCFAWLPEDESEVKAVKQVIRDLSINSHPPSVLVVIGIGGSNLGALAVFDAVFGKLANQRPGARPQVFFADTVDGGNIGDIVRIVDANLKAKKRVLVNVVSKSGSTMESVATLGVLWNLLRKRLGREADKHVVATTDEGSVLDKLAGEERWQVLRVPKRVGGRFSVFSVVGLFPLAVAGVDIGALLSGARFMLRQCTRKDVLQNPALVSAAILHHQMASKGIHDLFFFDTDLESLGKWYRQLFAESLGKQGKGMTPTVSIGTTDLHSMGQLYLGGPRDRFTTFVTVEKESRDLVVPPGVADELVPGLSGKSFCRLRSAVAESVMAVYRKKGLPFAHAALQRHDAHELGQFLQWKMLEMVYLASLMGVNAFDQPNVEEYKNIARRLLSQK